MKKLIINLLGLNSLAEELNSLKNEVLVLADENKELKKNIADLTEKVDEIEVLDSDDFVQHSDLDDNIESYLNNNDYATQDWVQSEIEDIDVSEQVESAIEDLDLTERVKEIVNDMDKPSFGDTEELKDIIRTVIRDGKFKFE